MRVKWSVGHDLRVTSRRNQNQSVAVCLVVFCREFSIGGRFDHDEMNRGWCGMNEAA